MENCLSQLPTDFWLSSLLLFFIFSFSENSNQSFGRIPQKVDSRREEENSAVFQLGEILFKDGGVWELQRGKVLNLNQELLLLLHAVIDQWLLTKTLQGLPKMGSIPARSKDSKGFENSIGLYFPCVNLNRKTKKPHSVFRKIPADSFV